MVLECLASSVTRGAILMASGRVPNTLSTLIMIGGPTLLPRGLCLHSLRFALGSKLCCDLDEPGRWDEGSLAHRRRIARRACTSHMVARSHVFLVGRYHSTRDEACP